MMIFYKRHRHYLNQISKSGNGLDYERRNLKIAIIDDQNVPYLDNLRNSGFNITHYTDIDNFEMIKSYPIVICDIKGVGVRFGSDKEGAYIISELKALYPDKYIIAMSSNLYNIGWIKLIEMADDKIVRDADVDKVFSSLNSAVEVMQSNEKRWLRIRENLIKVHKMDIFDVWEIEQAFIASSIKKDIEAFENSKVLNHTSDVVKGLLINFVSGLVFV